MTLYVIHCSDCIIVIVMACEEVRIKKIELIIMTGGTWVISMWCIGYNVIVT